MTQRRPEGAITGYFICATPRSGSTLLCDLLTDTGVAGRPASYFRRQSIANWAKRLEVQPDRDSDRDAFERAYLQAVRQQGAGETGIFGLRLMWETAAELSALLDRHYPGLPDDLARFEAAFGPTRYLHLSRADKVAQAVSLLKASGSGLWHLGADGSERERAGPAGEVAYDAAHIARIVAELEDDDRAWRSWFAAKGIEPIAVDYDALSANPGQVLAAILTSLDRDPAVAAQVAPRTAKLADHQSREWILRYRAEAGTERG